MKPLSVMQTSVGFLLSTVLAALLFTGCAQRGMTNPDDTQSAAPAMDLNAPPPSNDLSAPPPPGNPAAPPPPVIQATAPTEQITPEPEPQGGNYLVQQGDSLWTISAQPSVMGDPFRWPLLFIANRSQIKDPDLIYPHQEIAYAKNYSQMQIDEAVEKAKETPPYVPHSKPREELPLKY